MYQSECGKHLTIVITLGCFLITSSRSTDCRIGEFRCNSGTLYECFDDDRVCDGIKDCWDNSDEVYCDYAALNCEYWEFPCKIEHGHVCAPYLYRCDGYVDCIDKSDEKNCSENVRRH